MDILNTIHSTDENLPDSRMSEARMMKRLAMIDNLLLDQTISRNERAVKMLMTKRLAMIESLATIKKAEASRNERAVKMLFMDLNKIRKEAKVEGPVKVEETAEKLCFEFQRLRKQEADLTQKMEMQRSQIEALEENLKLQKDKMKAKYETKLVKVMKLKDDHEEKVKSKETQLKAARKCFKEAKKLRKQQAKFEDKQKIQEKQIEMSYSEKLKDAELKIKASYEDRIAQMSKQLKVLERERDSALLLIMYGKKMDNFLEHEKKALQESENSL